MLSKNKFLKGVMFHYFHNDKFFKKSPGSISANGLLKIINKLGQKNILRPRDFIEKIENKKIRSYHTCLTFDDSLRCQYKIAMPVMKKFNIKSFFFITTSVFTRNPNLMEIYRFFRDRYYKRLNHFYFDFYQELKKIYDENKLNLFLKKKKNFIKKQKKIYRFYTLEDIEFREVRDKLLKDNEYKKIMLRLFKKKKFNYKKKIKQLYLNKKDIKDISKSGHMIGLHSHIHPNVLSTLNYKDQKKDFSINKNILEEITGKKIVSASFPRGDYNYNTIKILKNLGIKIAFKDNAAKFIKSNLEIGRIDHNKI